MPIRLNASGWPEANEPYRLIRARIAPCFLDESPSLGVDASGFSLCDLTIQQGRIAQLQAHADAEAGELRRVDADHGLLLPGLADCHVHLDKAYVAQRRSFPAGDLHAAIAAMEADKAFWTPDDLRRRAGFGLRTAYAHGVRALRSHVDWQLSTPGFVWPLLREIAQAWRGRMDLQFLPLMPIDLLSDRQLRGSAVAMASEGGGVLSFFIYTHPGYRGFIGEAFGLAAAHGFDLDFHVDEGLDPTLDGLAAICETAIGKRFSGGILCGHCVALSVYDEARRARVLEQALEAGITIASLPQTNVFLQDRNAGKTPKLRGVTALNEIAQCGVPIAIGCDNVMDGFYPYGRFDPLEALALAVFTAHLPGNTTEWLRTVTTTPARVMRLGWNGQFRVGAPADFTVLPARTMQELLAQPHSGRAVVRAGQRIAETAPDLRELDGL